MRLKAAVFNLLKCGFVGFLYSPHEFRLQAINPRRLGVTWPEGIANRFALAECFYEKLAQ